MAVMISGFIPIFLTYNLLLTFVQKFWPLNYWQGLSVLFFTIVFFAKLAVKFLNDKLLRSVALYITVFLIILLVINGVQIILYWYATNTTIPINQLPNYKETEHPLPQRETPNIYYLIFDEYSAFDVMEQFYDYDNTKFLDFLRKSGFNVSLTSSNPIAPGQTVIPQTTWILANLLNLDYIAGPDDPPDLLRTYRWNGALYPLLEEYGYEVIGKSENDDFVGLSSTLPASTSDTKTQDGRSFFQIVLGYSIGSPFFNQYRNQRAEMILNWFQEFRKMDIPPLGGKFIMGHINFPHSPFVFTATGDRVKETETTNIKDKRLYKNQFIFATSLIRDTLEYIVTTDPQCVIILQSDHGMRYVDFSVPLEAQAKILNAVYFRGRELNIEGLSGLNTLIVTLNTVLDSNIPLRADELK